MVYPNHKHKLHVKDKDVAFQTHVHQIIVHKKVHKPGSEPLHYTARQNLCFLTINANLAHTTAEFVAHSPNAQHVEKVFIWIQSHPNACYAVINA